MKFKILQQGLVLISIPLFCELAMFAVLVKLELNAEMAAKRAAHARAVSDGVTTLEKDIHNIGKFFRSFQYKEALTANLNPYCDRLYADIDHLRQLSADRPEYLPLLQSTEQAVRRAHLNLEQARKAVISEPWSAYQIIKDVRKKLDTDLGEIISPQLMQLSSAYSDVDEEREAASARSKIRTILFGAVPISICFAIAAAIVFTKIIADRIAKLCRDAELMAKGERLSPVMSGSDEIAQLDQIYHQSAQMLADSKRKLQASYDYAADLILSVDDKLKISSVNKTCQIMLGLSPEELSNRPVVEIVAPNDRDAFLQLIIESRTDISKQLNRELSLADSNGRLIPTVCAPRFSRLEQSTFCVFHDISQRKEAERIRNEVFAMVTHDLRGPLTSFNGFLEFVEMGKMGELSEAGARLLPMAQSSASMMGKLLNDILTLEKVKSKMVQVRRSPLRLIEVLDEIAGTLFFAAEKRSIKIKVTSNDYIIETDRERLEQVLLNFLSNALKFAPEHTEITLFTEVVGDELNISVKDKGPGIKPEEIDSVFERFYEGTSGNSDLPSSGLGLTICKEVAQLLGGTVGIRSEVGQGSTFSLIFPKDHITNAKNFVS
jgi:PAS domain S-box-containing protein